MGERRRRNVLPADDHALVPLGNAEHALGEFVGQPDAAVRGGITRQNALMHGDPRPGDPLHEWHRRIAVEVRMMHALLADNREQPSRRRVAGPAGRNRRSRIKAIARIDGDVLAVQRDDEKHRPRWGRGLLDLFILRLNRLVSRPRRRSIEDGGGRSRDAGEKQDIAPAQPRCGGTTKKECLHEIQLPSRMMTRH